MKIDFDEILEKHSALMHLQYYGMEMYVKEAMREACKQVLDEAAERADIIQPQSYNDRAKLDKRSILKIKEEL